MYQYEYYYFEINDILTKYSETCVETGFTPLLF